MLFDVTDITNCKFNTLWIISQIVDIMVPENSITQVLNLVKTWNCENNGTLKILALTQYNQGTRVVYLVKHHICIFFL